MTTEMKQAEYEAASRNDPEMQAFDDFADAVEETIVTLKQKVDALTTEISQLRSASGAVLNYRGVWRDSEQYERGEFSTFDGGLWHANRQSVGMRPGKSDAWTLALKPGRDGRDRR